MSLIETLQPPSIRDRATQPNYAEQALEAIVEIARAADPPAVLDRLMTATAAMGATASIYTAEIPEDCDEPSTFSLYACHPALAQEHDRSGHLLRHPWLRFARTHTSPGTDQQIPASQPSDEEAIDLARRYGFRSSLVVPTLAGPDIGRVEMLCLGSRWADDFEGAEARVVRTLARSLAAELHDWLTRHLRERLQKTARLQKMDVDLLAMELQGLGTKEICMRTGMSSASVNSRFQRISARMQCTSRRAAAKRAAAYGVLEAL
ncbi:LuxR C-terminal-related transcriptional regulator [Roseateles sp.]|uniref:LuxR C-terminal-related transcriptional regulator n=1 Tax=Roseateles sp. TaxID=1971397 RepID=UPI0032661A9B